MGPRRPRLHLNSTIVRTLPERDTTFRATDQKIVVDTRPEIGFNENRSKNINNNNNIIDSHSKNIKHNTINVNNNNNSNYSIDDNSSNVINNNIIDSNNNNIINNSNISSCLKSLI